MEFFLKSPDPTSTDNEVILGMSPIKIRKRQTSGSLQLFFGTASTFTVSYCDTPVPLTTDMWHHFAFVIDISDQSLKCYFDGAEVNPGLNLQSIIATTLPIPTELYYGYTSVPINEEPF